jgi:opacity protein-like surface antigen
LDIKINDKFNVSGNTFFNATYGYKFTKNFGFEISALIPVNNNEFSTTIDSYRDWDGLGLEEDNFSDIQFDSYENSFEHNFMGNASLVFDLPMSDKFSFFANIGYTTGSVDAVVYTFDNNEPAANLEEALSQSQDICQLTGVEVSCSQDVLGSNEELEFKGTGFSYGAGIRFSFLSNDNINIGYNSYLNTSELDISGWSVNYQWNF